MTEVSLCTRQSFTQTCPKIHPVKPPKASHTSSPSSTKNECPSCFKWIHEDLKPWSMSGITGDMVERARKTTHFRLVIVIQNRNVFTIWGILQLLRWYPGRLPDVELLINCEDRPITHAKVYQRPKRRPPPPLFWYCGNESTLDIVFPDWSFCGWPEINIKPWTQVLMGIEEGNGRIEWENRAHYTYWKGNLDVTSMRKDLLKCNLTEKSDWNARLFTQDWHEESKQGYKPSNLQDHTLVCWGMKRTPCTILGEILSSDHLALPVQDIYRQMGMVEGHYCAIRENTKCTSLKFTAEWRNNNTKKARSIAEAGSRFIFNELKMDYVFDYMFHLLNEYTKLLRFIPRTPRGATEVCAEMMGCPANGKYSKYMMESTVNDTLRDRIPCSLPAAFNPPSLQAFKEKKAGSIWQVEMWENYYWKKVYAKKGH